MSQKQYNDENTGIIGKNDYKQKDSHPDQRGRVNVGGLWYWLSGWDKTANGRTFTSLAFTLMTQDEVDNMMRKRAEKERPQSAPQSAPQQQAAPQQTAQQSPPAHTQENPPVDNYDEDIPF